MSYSRRGTIFLLIFLSLITFAWAETFTEIVKKQFGLAPGGRVVLHNENGNIVVEGWDKDSLYVEAEKWVKTGSERDARKAMEEFRIIFKESDNKVIIKTRRPEGGGVFGWLMGKRISSGVRFTVYVPRNILLEVSSTNGAIRVSAVEGDLELETTNGKIVAEGIGGTIDASTTNGSIEVELVDLTETNDVELSTTNGSISLYLPEDAAFTLDAETTNGGIKTDFPLTVKGKYNSKEVRGKVNGGGPMISLETTNGSIKILVL